MLNNIFKYEIIFLFKNYCPTPCVNCPRFVSNCLSNNECSEIFLIILFKNIFEKYFSKIFFDLKSLICGFSKTAIFFEKNYFPKNIHKKLKSKIDPGNFVLHKFQSSSYARIPLGLLLRTCNVFRYESMTRMGRFQRGNDTF